MLSNTAHRPRACGGSFHSLNIIEKDGIRYPGHNEVQVIRHGGISVRNSNTVPVKELIEKAAKHWANIADGKEADTGPCELCKRFKGLCSVSEDGKMLEQPCPIYKATGLHNCDGTPFVAWREAAGDRFHDRYKPGGLRAETEELREAACAMAKFLGDLLKRYE